MANNELEGATTNAMGHVQDAYGGLIGDYKAQMKGKLNEGLGFLQRSYGKAKNQSLTVASTARDRVQSYAQQKPFVVMGIVGGVGMLLGFMLRGSRKNTN
jgi:uncharacterized protein YjbJ (UPF0337 family)